MLQLRCDSCGKDVSGSRQASIHHRYREHAEYRRAVEEWEKRHPHWGGVRIAALSDLKDRPQIPRWSIHCDGCNPHEDPDYPGLLCDGCYWFSCDRCDTPEKLIEITAHLMTKNWLQDTDWDKFLYRVLAQQPGGVPDA